MHTRLKLLLSTALLILCAWSTAAQSANCSGVASWNPSTIYNAGDRMVHNNRLYQANQQIWNAPPDYCPSCGWYTDLGVCSSTPNVPPQVAISSPTNGASFGAGANIAIAANASDSDGSVVRVEFFRGSTSIGVDTSTPFAATWSGATAGNHALTAVARDNAGANTTSAVVNITVTSTPGDTTAPSVPGGLASPSQTTSSITLSWSASTDNAGGSGVAGYDVYRNGALVGSPTATGYTDNGLAAST